MRPFDVLVSFARRLAPLCFSLALAAPLALGQAGKPVLWIDRDAQPGHFHRGWFLARGGAAADIQLDGTVTLAAAMGALGANDRFYTVIHGIVDPCVAGGAEQSGGRVQLEGASRAGYGPNAAAGSDPLGNCGNAGNPRAIPAQPNFTWRMMTCRGAAVPTWAGGVAVTQTAVAALPATATVWGAAPDIEFKITYRVAVGGGTPVQKQNCVNTLTPWSILNNGGRTVTEWFDATAVAGHGANVAALIAGPVAAYNAANATAINLVGVTFTYNPAIPIGPPFLFVDELYDDPYPAHLCRNLQDFVSFCAGDGTLSDHTTPCPCANNGAAGHGCANSVVAAGAHLTAAGSLALDDVALQGSGMPSSVSCIYLQGDALDDTVFGDGARCTGGTLLRLRTKTNVGGASSFPDSTDTITLSARGGVVPGSGSVRYYQTFYRNSAAGFCPPATFNVTNGIRVTW